MAKLLVTGGAGYVGSHTVHHLIGSRTPASNIVVLDNLERGHAKFVPPGVELVRGDLRNEGEVSAVFRQHEIESVLHFAAYAYVGESMQEPEKYLRNNVIGGLNLLQAVRRTGCRQFVFSSTCAVYGTPRQLPITEDFLTVPDNPYGESKRCFEDMLRWYAQLCGVRSICLRYFNAAGAAYGIGEWHEPETHLIPLVLQAALGQRPDITINGDDYPTRDGTCVRDYVHVADLADAHVKALRVLEQGAMSHARLNLGTGRGSSVREILKIAEDVSGRKIPVALGPRRAGDPAELYASANRARELLDWLPRRGLDEIIADAWQWHCKVSLGGDGEVAG